jgi:UPF0716 protein FxsA
VLRLIFAAFMVIPIIEIGLFILLGNLIGFWPTLLGVLVTALIGSAVLRYQGASLIAEIRATVGRGALPGRAIAEAMMVGMAGVLMVTPGYFTDLLGLLLLIPPVRGLVYEFLKRHVGVVAGSAATSAFGGMGPRRAPDDVVDLDSDEWRQR